MRQLSRIEQLTEEALRCSRAYRQAQRRYLAARDDGNDSLATALWDEMRTARRLSDEATRRLHLRKQGRGG